MKNKGIPIIIFFTVLFVLSGTAMGFRQVFPANPEEQAFPVSSERAFPVSVSGSTVGSFINVESSDSGIILTVENSFLADVLQQVANNTNIQFNVGSRLTLHRISVKIQGPNWNSVVETLLKDFSRVTVWNKKSNSMKEVLLLGKNNWAPPLEEFETTSFKNQTTGRKNRSQGLSISKLKRLVRIPQGHSIPDNLFADLEIRRYLELKGVQSPEEWKQPKKVRIVRHMAKRELTRLLFEKQRKLANKNNSRRK